MGTLSVLALWEWVPEMRYFSAAHFVEAEDLSIAGVITASRAPPSCRSLREGQSPGKANCNSQSRYGAPHNPARILTRPAGAT